MTPGAYLPSNYPRRVKNRGKNEGHGGAKLEKAIKVKRKRGRPRKLAPSYRDEEDQSLLALLPASRPRKQKGLSLWTALSTVVEFVGSISQAQEIQRKAITPNENLGKARGLGRQRDIEDQNLSRVGADYARRIYWQCTSIFIPANWAAKIHRIVVRQIRRHCRLVEGKYGLVHTTMGRAWIDAKPGWGVVRSIRDWLRVIGLINRWNASDLAEKLGVFLSLAAPHIDVAAGPGFLLPLRPHWHLLFAVENRGLGRGRLFRVKRALKALHERTGLVMTWEGVRILDRREEDWAERVSALVQYILRYPIVLVDPHRKEKNGNRVELPLSEGLRLYPCLPGWSAITALKSGTFSDHVQRGVNIAYGPNWDGLVDALALIPAMKALAGFVRVRTYDVPGDTKTPTGDFEGLPLKRAAEEKKTKAKRGAAQVVSERSARNENNVILSVNYNRDNEEVSLVVKNFTTHAELVRKLETSDLTWIVKLWRKKMDKAH